MGQGDSTARIFRRRIPFLLENLVKGMTSQGRGDVRRQMFPCQR